MKCQVCGKEIERSSYSNGIICSSECFHKNFWLEIIKYKNEYVVIDNSVYSIGPENVSKTSSRGCGGSKHIIRFFNGEEVITTNLWVIGKIPEEYREQLPDNAVFIREYYHVADSNLYKKAQDLWDYTLFNGRVDLTYTKDENDEINGMIFRYIDKNDFNLIRDLVHSIV